MTIKEKIKKEIDILPDQFIKQLYSYMQSFKKHEKQKQTKSISGNTDDWRAFTAQEFLKGHSKSDEIYDKL